MKVLLQTTTDNVGLKIQGCHGWHRFMRGVHGWGWLPSDQRAEAQSVLVRSGCVFYGYEESWRSGLVVVVNANWEESDVADVNIVRYFLWLFVSIPQANFGLRHRNFVAAVIHDSYFEVSQMTVKKLDNLNAFCAMFPPRT